MRRRRYGRRGACHPRHCRTCRRRHAVFRPHGIRAPVSSPDGERADRQAGGAASGSRSCSRPRATATAASCWWPARPGRQDAARRRRSRERAGTPGPARRRLAGPHAAVRAARRRPAHPPARAAGRPRRLRAAARPPRAAAARARRAGRRRPTARRCSRRCTARSPALGHALVLLDDLQWSDEATLEVLAALGESITASRVLIVAAYRSDGLPRGHGLRRLRHDLRRSGHLDELALRAVRAWPGPRALVARVLAARPAPTLVRAIHDRTEGVPFFARELAAALCVSGALRETPAGLELAGAGEVPLPGHGARRGHDPRRRADARARGARSRSPRSAARRFDLRLVVRARRRGGADRAARDAAWCASRAASGTFANALVREALYADLPWMARRSLHRRFAEALERRGEPAREIAPHWLGAHDDGRARDALVRAAAESEARPRLPRRRRAPGGSRSSAGRRARTTRRGPSRSSATPAAASSRASWRRPRGPGGS